MEKTQRAARSSARGAHIMWLREDVARNADIPCVSRREGYSECSRKTKQHEGGGSSKVQSSPAPTSPAQQREAGDPALHAVWWKPTFPTRLKGSQGFKTSQCLQHDRRALEKTPTAQHTISQSVAMRCLLERLLPLGTKLPTITNQGSLRHSATVARTRRERPWVTVVKWGERFCHKRFKQQAVRT